MAVAVIFVLSKCFLIAGKAMQISRFFEIASFCCGGLIGVLDLGTFVARSNRLRTDHSRSPCESHHLAHGHSHAHAHDHSTRMTVHACCSSHEQDKKAKTARRSIWAMVRRRSGFGPCTGAVLCCCFSLSAGIFCVGARWRRSRWHYWALPITWRRWRA